MTYIFLGLLLVLMFLVARASLKKAGVFMRLSIHVLGGIVGLWIFDLVLSLIGFAVPINVFTIILVGLLGLPGVFALSALQLLGI